MRTVRDFEWNRLEAAVFIWSQNDPSAGKTFNRVYKMWLDFVRKIFNEIGFKGVETDMRAQLFMGYLAW